MDPAQLNMRIPSGRERNAYGSWWDKDKFVEGQWEPKGTTSGGAAEAVIDKVSLAELQTLPKSVLDIEPCSSMAANTKRVLDEKSGRPPATS